MAKVIAVLQAKRQLNCFLFEGQHQEINKLAHGLNITKSDYVRLLIDVDRAGLIPDNLKSKLLDKRGRRISQTRFFIRLSKEHLGRLSQQADKFSATVSAYFRALLSIPLVPGTGQDAVIVIDAKELANLVRAIRGDLGRIGKNVNQIAYGLNVLQKQRAFPTDYVRELFTACERRLADCDDHLAQLSEQILVVIELLVSLDSEHVPFVNGGADIREGRLDLDQEKMN